MLVIGLMSGTSADGVDAALVEWPNTPETRPFRLIAFTQEAYPRSLQERIHSLAAGRVEASAALGEFGELDVLLAERFATAATAVAQAAGVGLRDVACIASHGQTVGHFPERAATLQIGSGSWIAEQTGCTTVANFRPRDLAAGGEGAPLAPFFHVAAFSDTKESRAILNLGGIANITWIPAAAQPEDVLAFDVGPANVWIDAVVQIVSGGKEALDRGGERARSGKVDAEFLAKLLDDPFLCRMPPKSTGRERYGLAEAEAFVRDWHAAGKRDDDLVATLTQFTVEAVARACRELLGGDARVERLLVGGGGALNAHLMRLLAQALPATRVEPFDAAGVPVRAAEAMAFSLLGRNTLIGVENHLPRCTGAKRATILGEISLGRLRREKIGRY